jgi:hypothetical protein
LTFLANAWTERANTIGAEKIATFSWMNKSFTFR